MERIGVRELRQHASRYLAKVKRGETVEVTERGKLIALLTPPSSGNEFRDRLIAEGRLIPAREPFRFPRRHPQAEGAPTMSEVLDELREERL